MQALAQSYKVIYADGGCRNTTTKVGAYSFVCIEMQHQDHMWLTEPKGQFLFGYTQRVEDTTNNMMELQAVLEALVECTRRLVVPDYVITDSQYVQKGLTEWLPKWVRNNWRTANNSPVKNKALWEQLVKWCPSSVEILHVRGHQGIYWNEACDEWCTQSMTGFCNDVREVYACQ